MHRKTLFLLIALLFTQLSNAQIGITAGYTSLKADPWAFEIQQELGELGKVFASGTQIGVNGWFRLKNIRIEFLPTLEYTNAKATFPITRIAWTNGKNDTHTFGVNSLGINLNTRVYPFDFKGDCHCPTFSKQGQYFKKGFFLQVSPGYYQVETSRNSQTESSTSFTSRKEYKASLSAGAGFDFGLSDLLTLSPIVHVRYFDQLNGDHLMSDKVLNDDYSNLWQLFAGINIGLRFKQ